MRFNPRSPCGERPAYFPSLRICLKVSIHAPRVGSDITNSKTKSKTHTVSIHAPRVGSDAMLYFGCSFLYKFQSTLPVWGATVRLFHITAELRVSIHAPRVGSDDAPCSIAAEGIRFNPRSPCGERPSGREPHLSNVPVSIHAPRVGSDSNGEYPNFTVWVSIHAPRVGSDGTGR